ncbi:hypothetical protein P9G84_16430 [Brevibacillus centrosporus]|uniref:hypothetical protein n=1 Tax=Brevibacillus centrosporus TaxID=54910 RepID=UPI0011411958|nr:hypothetical protein [Brevibacillus centrosporus]MEC2130523.1 hypothetical protein [Brevibacillus centrosporus]GED34861.1 hypothetical protein BCE02nite_60020 [Brevibacillus centrosporus]
MKRFSFQQKISWSLLAVLVASPFASAHASVTISGTSQLNGGMQINAPTTLNVQGGTTISGNVTVRQPFTINPDPTAQGNAFSQAGFTLIPALLNLPIDLGGVSTGIVTVGNTNVGQVLGADGVSQIQPAPGVPVGQVTLDGSGIDSARQALQTAILNADITVATTAQSNYQTEGGDLKVSVYTDVTQAITALTGAKTAAQNLLNKGTATLSELGTAKNALSAAQGTLQSKVTQLDIATQALKDYAAALALAKTALSDEIAAVDVSPAQTALDDFESAKGDIGMAVYTDVEAAIQDLNSKKAAGKSVLDSGTSTLQQVQAATTAITDAQTTLTNKKTLLEAATQALIELAQAKTALSNTIASVNVSTAQTSLANYVSAQGDTSLAVYTDVEAAIQDLNSKKSSGEGLLSSSSVLADVQAATQAISQAQTELNGKVALLDTATQAAEQLLNNAKDSLDDAIIAATTTIDAVETSKAAYIGASGSQGATVYTDVEAAVQNLNRAKANGQTILGTSTSTLAELQAATTAITNAQTVLTSKKTLLDEATQVLQDLAQGKAALSNAIASADVSAAQAALDDYEAVQGDTSLAVYTDVETAIGNLSNAKAAGQAVLADSTSVLADIQAATQAIQQAQNLLNGKVTSLEAATDDLKQALLDAKNDLNAAIASVDVTEAQQAQTAYTDKGGDTSETAYTDVTSAIANLQQAKTEAEAIDQSIATLADLQSMTTAINEAQSALDAKVALLKTATDELVFQEVVSKDITQFDFSTIYAGQARITSKPITSTDFASNPKHFTVSDGNITIDVDLTWNIPLNGFTTGQVVGSAVDSFIQQYYNDHHIDLGQRTMAGIGFDDTFSVTRFQTGSSNVITVGGSDWDEFFDTNTATGSDTDTSQNRTFTISDGTKTATINLEWKLDGMDDLVDTINDELTSAGVLATAVKESASTFKIVAKKANITITTGGADSNDFF